MLDSEHAPDDAVGTCLLQNQCSSLEPSVAVSLIAAQANEEEFHRRKCSHTSASLFAWNVSYSCSGLQIMRGMWPACIHGCVRVSTDSCRLHRTGQNGAPGCGSSRAWWRVSRRLRWHRRCISMGSAHRC